MAITVTTPATALPFVPGNLRCTVRDVVLDDSYPTGGESLTAADLGMSVVSFAIATVKVAGTGSVTAVHYDVATSKLLAYTAAAQVGNTVDVSAVTVQVIAFGK
jgi:hypothetical protein